MNVMTLIRTLIVAFILCVGAPAIAEVHGILRVVKGDVQIKSGSTGVTSKAKLGQEVYPKDTIITGKDARAKIVMIDNNELNISPDSHIEIQNYEYNPTENKKDVLLNVLYGKVRSKVEQKYDGKTSKFQVKTPSAVAGVRGTDFVTGYNQLTKMSTVITFRGAVEFGLPGANGAIRSPVSVTPGKMSQISASGGSPAAPSNVPKDQLAKFDHDTKAEVPAGGNSAPTGEPRTPAGKSGDSNGNSSSNTGTQQSSTAGLNAGSDRNPASTGTNAAVPIPAIPGAAAPTMLHPEDLVSGPNQQQPIVLPPPPPVAPPPVPPPPPPTMQRPLSGNGAVSVHVTP
jgi:hypothetical protein